MKKVYLLDDTIISPLGFSTLENISSVKNQISGLKFQKNKRFKSGGFYVGIIEEERLKEAFSEIGDPDKFTKLEQMMLLALHPIVSNIPNLNNIPLIISTTKGNIDLLQNNSAFPESRVYLSELAKVISNFYGFKNEPIVVSNACISGGLAMAVAKRFIASGKFENAIVVGGDLVSDFVISGFQSLQAISENACKPFSKDRSGISLGEGAAALLLSSQPKWNVKNITLTGVATTNDANHIAGPSRTGEGLYKSIQKALGEAEISAEMIDYISAHGTATRYNDEMEAIAFNRAGLQEVPLNSIKGYYGHTLGASALIESIITKHSLLNNELYKTLNFEGYDLSKPLNIIEENEERNLKYALKTASGFGGCNLAMIFKKEENGS